MRMPLLHGNARELIDSYNRGDRGPSYNQVAEKVYGIRRKLGDPLSPQFEAAVLDGLMGFGMGITIKGGRATLYPRLRSCLDTVRKSRVLDQFRDCCISSVDLRSARKGISTAYDCLALAGTLHPTDQSHVGATKTLHWLFPELFLIVDGNVAQAFRTHYGIRFSKTTQPGYSSEKYLACLEEAQKEIQSFGVEPFRRLEPMTPVARIFDKISFTVGKRLAKADK
jgi:hypothetical protein